MMRIIIIVFLATMPLICLAQKEDIRKEHFNINKHNLAIDGYDPVSYFSDGPLKGEKEINYAYKGITYWFVSETNKSTFRAAPLNYEPQYGGWCAFALGQREEKVRVDPEAYKITDGKLFLFYNFYFTNTLVAWNKNEYKLIDNADKNWNSLIIQQN